MNIQYYGVVVKFRGAFEHSVRFSADFILTEVMRQVVMDFEVVISVVEEEFSILITDVAFVVSFSQMLYQLFFIIEKFIAKL